MKATKSFVKERFRNALSVRMARHGFVDHGGRLERVGADVSVVMTIAFLESRATQDMQVSIGMGVRHQRVEELAVGWRADLSAEEQQKTVTVGAELGKIVSAAALCWSLNGIGNVPEVVEGVAELFEKHGLPYIDAVSRLETVIAMFEDSDWRKWHQSMSGRAFRMPVIYALLGRENDARKCFRAQYDHLVSKGDPLSKDYPNFALIAGTSLGINAPLANCDDKVR